MASKKHFFFLLFFLVCFLPLFKGQIVSDTLTKKQQKQLEKKSRNKFIGAHLGFVSYNYKDFIVSPLTYSGLKLTESVQYYSRGDKKITNLKFNLASGVLKSEKELGKSVTKLNHYFLEYYTLYYINSLMHDKWKLYLGYNPSVTFDRRTNEKFRNSAVQHNGQIDVAPIMQIDRRFILPAKGKFLRKKEKNIRLAWQLTIPVVSVITRPAYNGISPDMGRTEKVTSDLNFQIHSLNNYFRMSNTISADIYFKNNNGIRISYVSDVVNMYKNIEGRRLQYSNSGFMIGLLIKLDDNTLK